MAHVIRMPEVLTGATEAALQSWLVNVGDSVHVGQSIAEVETEKATVEYEAEAEGTIAALLAEVGIQVDVGTPIAVLATGGESKEDAITSTHGEIAGSTGSEPASEAPPHMTEPPSQDSRTEPPSSIPPGPAAASTGQAPAPRADVGGESRRIFMSPLVRRLASERGLDVRGVSGSGPGGRIVRRDLESLEASPLAQGAPATPVAPEGTGFATTPHTGMRRAIARRLVESKSSVPHFYLVADCRVEALLDLRKAVNATDTPKVSLNDLVVKAAAVAFRDVPDANAVWTDEGIRRFDHVDIAVAVAIDGGLVTPVVRAVEQRSLSEVSSTIRDLAERAHSGKLKQDEIEGGSFSISNLGMYGTQSFSAIINPPHSGILAVGAARRAPVVVDDELTVGTVMTVTLSADHRVLDGALAAQWLAAFVARIENPVSILI